MREIVELALITLVLYLAIWTVLQTVRVEGDSMLPTLHTGDLLLASKLSYHLHDPERGDIVILNPPIETSPATGGERDFIKRVIGIPGDVIEIDSSKHPAQILVKPGGAGPWQRLAEPYLGQPWEQASPCCDASGRAAGTLTSPAPFTVPKDDFYVLGDNRNFSQDSRVFGFVAKNRILAKAFFRIWPVGGLGSGPSLVPSAVLLVPAAVRLRPRRRSGHSTTQASTSLFHATSSAGAKNSATSSAARSAESLP